MIHMLTGLGGNTLKSVACFEMQQNLRGLKDGGRNRYMIKQIIKLYCTIFYECSLSIFSVFCMLETLIIKY